MKNYVERFEELGFGMFIHFGLYSVEAKGEWYLTSNPKPNLKKYEGIANRFNPVKTWAKELVNTAKKAGCKYITITTRHHDGFSLYDTKGLSDFDVMHKKCKRDLIKEFVDECNKGGIVPLFYHTLLDWHNKDYKDNFPKYIDYLVKSIEILCTNYGKIGGLWFDGMWDKPNADWQEDRIYSTIRKYQPEAMIINNTGLSERGKVGHPELDSVTFERGKPCYVDNSDKHRAGEMCQVLNDHWGYAKNDLNYKPVKEFIENLIDCRKFGCNFLLNTGLKGNGKINEIDKAILLEVGKWIKVNKGIIYSVKPVDLQGENADFVSDGESVYAIIKNVPMCANVNVALDVSIADKVKINGRKIKKGIWLDDGKKIKIEKGNSFTIRPFDYGTSYSVRIAKLTLE